MLLSVPIAGMSNSSAFHEEGEQDNTDNRPPHMHRKDNSDDNSDDDEDSDEKRRIFSPDNRFRLTPTTFAPSKYVVKVLVEIPNSRN
jgi:hypothetical protein